MSTTPSFQVSTTDTEIIVRFQKAAYPAEVAALEAATRKAEEASQTGDRQQMDQATMELQQTILALLRAPSDEQRRTMHPRY